MAKHITAQNYRKDPLYPRIAQAVAAILSTGEVVTPVDVLIHMKLLKLEQLKDWRHGRIPYLERVILGNLSKLSRLLRVLHRHALDRGLKPSTTVYMKWGKGAKHRLRFSKTGDPHLEEAYSLHFVRPRKDRFHPPADRQAPGQDIPDADGGGPVEQAGDSKSTNAAARPGPRRSSVPQAGAPPPGKSGP